MNSADEKFRECGEGDQEVSVEGESVKICGAVYRFCQLKKNLTIFKFSLENIFPIFKFLRIFYVTKLENSPRKKTETHLNAVTRSLAACFLLSTVVCASVE